MDVAIIRHAGEDELKPLQEEYAKVDEVPFDFERRRMSVVVEDRNRKRQLITKGAIEEMLGVCSCAEYEGKVRPLSEDLKTVILRKANEFNKNGFRVLGIAHKNESFTDNESALIEEKEMVLIGYLAFLDPPKASAEEAVSTLRDYGVDVKILTGDNDAVTGNICEKVGIPADHMLLGADLEKMTDDELFNAADDVSVFAKLSPDQKTRVVTVLRGRHTVGFMLRIGPTSSVFDIATYLMMFFVICPAALHGGYSTLDTAGKLAFAALFQAGWFVESQWTQTLVIHSLRTGKTPFIQSRASLPVFLLTGMTLTKFGQLRSV